MLGEPIMRPTYYEAVTRDTACNETLPSPTIEKRTAITDAANLTKATTIHQPKEPRPLRINKAETETRDPRTMVPPQKVESVQVSCVPVSCPDTPDHTTLSPGWL